MKIAVLLSLLMVIPIAVYAQETENLRIEVVDLGMPEEIAEKYIGTEIVYQDIQVKIPHAVTVWKCHEPIVNPMNLQPTTTCIFEGNSFTTSDMIVPKQTNIPEIEDVDPFPLDANKDGVITKQEKAKEVIRNTIAHLEKKCVGGCSVSNQTALDMLKSLAECQQGLGGTAAFQPYDTWIIPANTITDADGKERLMLPDLNNPQSSIPIKGTSYGQIAKDLEWCNAQKTLQQRTDITHYPGMIVGQEDFQPYHADMATAIATWTDRQDGDLKGENNKAQAWACSDDNQFWSNDTKQQQCPDWKLIPDPQIVANPDKIIGDIGPVYKNPALENARMHGLVCGLIAWEHIVDDRYLGYLDELQESYTCDAWPRITGIMIFDPRAWDQPRIEQWILDYEAKQEIP